MKSSWNGNNPDVLAKFLLELIYQAKHPKEMELLVEVFLSIQQVSRPALSRLAEETPVDSAT